MAENAAREGADEREGDLRAARRAALNLLEDAIQARDALRKTEDARRLAETEYQTLFESIDEGFCIIEVLFDEGGKAGDYRFVRVNPAFEEETGLRGAVGRTMRELAPGHEQYWFDIYGRVAATGMPERFEQAARALGRTFDVYASRIGAQGENRVAILFNDITERKAAEAIVAAARDAAEEANRIKDEFLATLSHELRTPLSAILLWSKLLRPTSTPEQVEEGLQAIRRSAEAQRELIDDLLDLARITSGKLRVHLSDVDLVPVVDEALETIRPTADAKGVRLEKQVGAAHCVIAADPGRLQQVLWNLLTNAVKFTPGGGNVAVRLEVEEQAAKLTVSDTGRGIEAAFLPHVFDPFRQQDMGITRTHGGLGLGLSIVKRLVELHGGSISVRSDGPGQGAVFTAVLPLPKGQRSGSGSGSGQSSPALQGIKILLVEDDRETRNALAFTLRHAGGTVKTVATAADAMAVWKEFGPDVLVSDIGLPETDGIELLRQARATTLRAVPAVAISAFTNDEMKSRALAAGFATFLPKPIDADRLLETLARLKTEVS